MDESGPGTAGAGPVGTACPFVGVAGECVIYAHRPLVCRGYNSGDVGQCLEFAASGFRKRPTLFNKPQSDVGLAARAAVALAIDGGRAPRTVNLVRGVLAALAPPDSPPGG